MHNILSIISSKGGDFVRARHHGEQSLHLAQQLTDPSARVAALNNLALAYGADSDAVRAIELAEAALAAYAS